MPLDTVGLLLDNDDAEAEQRWAELDEHQLDREVGVYREGIKELTTELTKRGVSTSLNNDLVENGASDRPSELEVCIWLQRCFADPLGHERGTVRHFNIACSMGKIHSISGLEWHNLFMQAK